MVSPLMTEYAWYLYALIPIISGAIGYVTNVVAVKMMFYPTKFVGIPPYLGWQGIVPANRVVLAQRGLSLITAKLLKISEVLEDVDAEDFIKPAEGELKERTRQVLETQAQTRFAAMWGALGASVKEQMHQMAWTEVRTMSTNIVNQIMVAMPEVLNLQNVVVRAVKTQPKILTRMFLEVGSAEFKFIERSGWYFGGGFGLVQLIVWLVYPAWFVLPFFGFLVGYATNWIAIKLVFEPKEPVKYAGITFHGLFHQRQKEVAAGFAKVSTEDLFNDENLFFELQSDEAKARLMSIVAAEADALTERYKKHPMVGPMMTDEMVSSIRDELMAVTEAELFKEGGVISGITAQSKKIRTMLHERMLKMDADDFEAVLRPAFQQDEWKLILAGAVLGFGAGVLQLIYLFGQSFGG